MNAKLTLSTLVAGALLASPFAMAHSSTATVPLQDLKAVAENGANAQDLDDVAVLHHKVNHNVDAVRVVDAAVPAPQLSLEE